MHIQFYESVLTGVDILLIQGGLHELNATLYASGYRRIAGQRETRSFRARQEESWAAGPATRRVPDSLAKRGGHTLQQVLRYGGWIFSIRSTASFVPASSGCAIRSRSGSRSSPSSSWSSGIWPRGWCGWPRSRSIADYGRIPRRSSCYGTGVRLLFPLVWYDCGKCLEPG